MTTIEQEKASVQPIAKNLRSFREAVESLDDRTAHSPNLVRRPLQPFPAAQHQYFIPRYLFIGPRGGGEPIRVAFIAGVYGNEPEGSLALIEFIHRLDLAAEIARDFCLFLYPIANPTGFDLDTKETRDGANIANELWRNSSSPEVQALQSELWMHGFDGVVSFRVNPEARELSVAVGGSIFFRHLLGTTLPQAQDLVPQVIRTGHNALPAWRSVLLDEPNELIRAAPGLKPRPFEVVITIPRQLPLYLTKAALTLVLQAVLTEYRKFIAYGANI